MERTYYIYRHVRHDKNEPFYIGRGVVNEKDCSNEKRRYHRAFSLRRNIFWKRIVAKTGYDIDILFETTNQTKIREKEIEFIKLYGRSDMKMGTLCNLTDGGDGLLEVNGDILKRMLDKRILSGANKRMGEKKSKAVHVYDLNGKYIQSFISRTAATKSLNVNETSMLQSLKSKISTWIYFFSDVKQNSLDLNTYKRRNFKSKNNSK